MIDLSQGGQRLIGGGLSRRQRVLLWSLATLGLAVLALQMWSSDRITAKGERTIYTAKCENGKWEAGRCGGRLLAAERFRFRALRSKGEVLYWVVGSPSSSGKLTGCVIEDGRNWACELQPHVPPPITYAMKAGQAVDGPAGLSSAFHPVSKWKWTLLRRFG